MIRRIARLSSVVVLALAGAPNLLGADVRPEERLLRAHVETLSSPRFLGRKGEGGRLAAEYLVDQFRKLALEPLFDGDFRQEIPGKNPGEPIGRNVGGLLRGNDPTLENEAIILSAHFDHLGVRGGRLYPGADDNASGVAMMLEVARSLVEGQERPRRSVMFIGFDLEEDGLFGSRYFIEHPPVPLSNVRLFLTADMIGRALGGVCDPYVFVMGTEHAPALRPWVEEAARGKAVTVGLLGSDLLLIDRSDYGPFRTRKIPYLFFSTGENPAYHATTDVAETLNYPKLEAISRTILDFVRQASSAESLPGWSVQPDNPLAEAETVRTVLRMLLEHREKLAIGSPQVFIMNNTLRSLDAIMERGVITPEERTGMVRAARIILLSIF